LLTHIDYDFCFESDLAFESIFLETDLDLILKWFSLGLAIGLTSVAN